MMSHICLFVLFLAIAVQFGDCENSGNIDCTPSAPGSDKTHLSYLERKAEKLKIKLENKENNTFSHFLEKIPFIAPGTLWCGNGDLAKNENDLGYFKGTDACCRSHDNCKNDIISGDTKVNLKNNGLFTRSACPCDHEFYNCLKNVSSFISKGIGKTYFNILQPQCFQCTCPSNGCQINIADDYCNGQCTKYEWVNNIKF